LVQKYNPVTILIANSSATTHTMQVSHHITCELQLNDGSTPTVQSWHDTEQPEYQRG
jgi:hypothetical protein